MLIANRLLQNAGFNGSVKEAQGLASFLRDVSLFIVASICTATFLHNCISLLDVCCDQRIHAFDCRSPTAN